MKKLLSFLIIVAFMAIAAAQTSNVSKLSIGPEFGLPVGNYADLNDFGIGLSIIYQHKIVPALYVTGNAGYVGFIGKGSSDSDFFRGISYIPLKAGLKYFFVNNIYLSGEAGVSLAPQSYTIDPAFAFSSGIGVELPVSKNNAIEVGARYEGWSNTITKSFVGFRVAFNVGL